MVLVRSFFLLLYCLLAKGFQHWAIAEWTICRTIAVTCGNELGQDLALQILCSMYPVSARAMG